MINLSYIRHIRGLTLKLLGFAVALSASNALAQRAGHWTGTNSFGEPFEFTVSADSVITNYSTGLYQYTCPSGAMPFVLALGGGIPILRGGFRVEYAVRDGSGYATVFSGTFTSDTEASGDHHEDAARFRLEGKDVSTQICTSDFTWTAAWESANGAEPESKVFGGKRRYIQITPE